MREATPGEPLGRCVVQRCPDFQRADRAAPFKRLRLGLNPFGVRLAANGFGLLGGGGDDLPLLLAAGGARMRAASCWRAVFIRSNTAAWLASGRSAVRMRTSITSMPKREARARCARSSRIRSIN